MDARAVRGKQAKGGRSFVVIAASLVLLAAIAFSTTTTHDDKTSLQQTRGYTNDNQDTDYLTNANKMTIEPVFDAPSISFHTKRNRNSIDTTTEKITSTTIAATLQQGANDFIKEAPAEVNLFDLKYSNHDPLSVSNVNVIDIEKELTNEQNESRLLMTTCTEPEYLYPLPCNEGIDNFDCTEIPLSSLLPEITDGSPLVIECGTCVYVDTTNGGQLDLPNGLRIEGKLYFPSDANITIRTIYVMVLGVLKMDTPQIGNQVKFSLHSKEGIPEDSDEQNIFFYADPDKQDSRTSQCVDGCKIGKKPIAVVGGELDSKIMGTCVKLFMFPHFMVFLWHFYYTHI